jgi:radical SAM protein with 4Fe4S-binding SPASM domain
VYSAEFMPSFDQYWQAFNALFARSEILSVTEPLIHTFLGLKELHGTPCGSRSIRVTPDRLLKACVYWPDSDVTIEDLVEKREAVFQLPSLQQPHAVPDFCRDCQHVSTCGGGCAARRMLRGQLASPDEYCPIVRGMRIVLQGKLSAAVKPLRTGSICTTIVRGHAR